MSLLKQVEGLVLRKFDYSETSLIFALLTKDDGQLRFILKGARKGSKTKFPAIDLFRHVSLQFNHKPSVELHTVRSCDLVESFDALAKNPRAFRAAAWLCRLMDRNTMPEEPCGQQYTATLNAFRRLCAGDQPLAVCAATVVTALDEHGVLPDLTTMPDQHDALNYLLRCARDHSLPMREYEPKEWSEIFGWAVSAARSGDLEVPDTERLR